jgi:D-alanyl-D-alanine carboxypeptidase
MEKSVEAHLEKLVGSSKVPGIQYLVVDSGGVAFECATGWADIGESMPMTSATTLMAYSMSKTITAAAVLRLAEQGALGLDDSVARYVENLPYLHLPAMTVRQLLTHTAGVPTAIPLRWVHPSSQHSRFDERAALAAQLRRHSTLRSAPGEAYAYSNLGYWLLGPVVEAASGESFEICVTNEVLRPLGVSPTELSFAVPDPDRHATGYLEKYSFLNLFKRFFVDRKLIGDYQGRWLQINPHYVNGPSFGGLIGNAHGFGRFLQDQLGARSVLLGDRLRTVFYEPAHTLDGNEIPMTAGWHVSEGRGARHFYKEGGGGGFHCMMRLYREPGIGTVALTNATAFDVRHLLDVLDPRFLPCRPGS